MKIALFPSLNPPIQEKKSSGICRLWKKISVIAMSILGSMASFAISALVPFPINTALAGTLYIINSIFLGKAISDGKHNLAKRIILISLVACGSLVIGGTLAFALTQLWGCLLTFTAFALIGIPFIKKANEIKDRDFSRCIALLNPNKSTRLQKVWFIIKKIYLIFLIPFANFLASFAHIFPHPVQTTLYYFCSLNKREQIFRKMIDKINKDITDFQWQIDNSPINQLKKLLKTYQNEEELEKLVSILLDHLPTNLLEEEHSHLNMIKEKIPHLVTSFIFKAMDNLRALSQTKEELDALNRDFQLLEESIRDLLPKKRSKLITKYKRLSQQFLKIKERIEDIAKTKIRTECFIRLDNVYQIIDANEHLTELFFKYLSFQESYQTSLRDITKAVYSHNVTNIENLLYPQKNSEEETAWDTLIMMCGIRYEHYEKIAKELKLGNDFSRLPEALKKIGLKNKKDLIHNQIINENETIDPNKVCDAIISYISSRCA